MSLSKVLMYKAYEARGKLVKSITIKDGTKQLVAKRMYTTELKDGYTRDADGSPVRMSSEERRNRSKAAEKSANSPITKVNKANSMRRRETLID